MLVSGGMVRYVAALISSQSRCTIFWSNYLKLVRRLFVVVSPWRLRLLPRICRSIDSYCGCGRAKETLIVIDVHVEFQLDVLLPLYGQYHRHDWDAGRGWVSAQLEVIPRNSTGTSSQVGHARHLQIEINSRERVGSAHGEKLGRYSQSWSPQC